MQQHCRPLPSASMPLNSSIDFEFDVGIENTDQECYYSSADELFSNGRILPLQIRKKISPQKQQLQRCPPPPPPQKKKKKQQQLQPPTQKPQTQAGNATPKQIKVASKEANDQNQSCMSFWQFKRSSSLNFVSGYKVRLCPPSTPLSRSSSTWPAPKLKQGHVIGNHRQNRLKDEFSYPCLHSSTNNQNPPLKKSFAYGSHGNGVTINPVLNVPSVDVFCLSPIFLTGKDKKQ
ncbi:hypothetical protein DITRI_Ditri11bG0010500 [Diplodiscus trichospermus]